MKKLLLLSAALLTAAPGLGSAQSRYSISVTNNLNQAVWVTTYANSTRRSGILGAQCLLPGQKQLVPSQDHEVGGWTLFEIKKEANTCAVHSNDSVIEKNVKAYAVMQISGNRDVIVSK